MSDQTGISWTDATWNPVSGCDRVSPGCDNCYALTLAKRLKAMGNPRYQADGDPRTSGPGFGVSLHPEALEQPLKWRKPRRIFVNSMADLFHESVPDGYIARVWDVMGRNQQHTYQILTKRHARLRSWLRKWADQEGDRASGGPSGMPPMPRGPEAVRNAYASGRARLFADMLDSMGDPPEGCAYPLYDWMEGWRFWGRDLFNVHVGVSAENQKWYDIRWFALADAPAAVRFISAEPLLGPIDLGLDHTGHESDAVNPWPHTRTCMDCSAGEGEAEVDAYHRPGQPKPDWVIAGGESGPGHRPMEMAWLESIANQCRMASIPLYVKQDSGPRAGQQGRIPDGIWALKQFPGDVLAAA
jgi:protein gp37